MGIIVIAAYRPLPGKEKPFLELLKSHVPVLRKEGLATERPPLVMQSKNGMVLEIFEWKSKEAVEAAHHNKNVTDMWELFSEVCHFEIPALAEELQHPFAEFNPIALDLG